MTDIRMRGFGIRQLSFLSVMLLIAMNLGAAESFYEGYSESERLVIAGAYLAVGEQYAELGDDEKAASYKAMAEEIFPGIESVEPLEAPPVDKTDQVEAAAPVRPSGKEPAAVQYYFTKMLRAVFTENERDLNSLLSTRLYLPGYDDGVKKEEVQQYIRYAFDKYPLEKTDPSRIYKVDRLFIRPEGSAWVASLFLTDEGIRIFEEEIGFTGELHKFYFREYREGWRLIAISGE